MSDDLKIYLFAILLAFINTFWLRYQLDKEKRTNKHEGVKFGNLLLAIIPAYGIFVFWHAGIAIGFYTIIIFLIVHFMFEKMFKLPKDARFKKR